MIGPRDDVLVSGSTLLFGQLAAAMRARRDIDLRIISTSRPTHRTLYATTNLAVALRVVAGLLWWLGRTDVVVFHGSRRGLLQFGPVVTWIAHLARRPVVLRLFGGDFEPDYREQSALSRRLFDTVALKADVILVETRALRDDFRRRGAADVRWYPNSRPMSASPAGTRSEVARRFVFAGRVSDDKGVGTILDAVAQLGDTDISVDLYGSFAPPYTAELIRERGRGRVSYRGQLPFDAMIETFAAYDALVFPTTYHGEGYPGVVIEAYAAGIPVIVTAWRAIPEIVDERTGILVEPGSAASLAQALSRLRNDAAQYAALCAGVRERRGDFRDDRWADTFVDWCRELAAA